MLKVIRSKNYQDYLEAKENLKGIDDINIKKLICLFYLYETGKPPNHIQYEYIQNILISYKNEILALNNKYLDVVKHIREYIGVSTKEKVNFGEVFTPNFLIEEMLDALPTDVWSNPNLKWLDPANGIGNYPACIIPRLMKGLETIFLDVEERYEHIMRNMIYVCDIQEKNMFSYCMLFDLEDKYKMNIYKGDFLKEGFDEQMLKWGVTKFDIIIGNPPYQKMDKGNKSSAQPIYDKFIIKADKISNIISFITPSRWFAGGKGLDGFRDMMLNRNDIRLIKHYNDNKTIFDDVVIKGGVSYFIIDKNYEGLCDFNNNKISLNNFDIIPTNINTFSLITKLNNYINISSIAYSRSHYSISTNMVLSSFQENNDFVKVFFSMKNGNEKWIDKKYIKDNTSIKKWKVITPRATGKEMSGFGRIFIGKPNEICNDSFIHFTVETELEAINLKLYLETKFCNFILSLKKISQDVSMKTISWIPLVDLSKKWSNEDLYREFQLTPDEILLIENFNF